MKSPGKPEQDPEILLFEDQKAWQIWLGGNYRTSAGVWLRLAKKSSGLHSLTYQEALDVALCHGWIDGQKKSYDAQSWLQKFTTRGPKSIWSKINRARALALIDAGRMQPAGLAAIEQARENGQWEGAYDSHRTAQPPEDFQSALDANPDAAEFYATLNSANRYAILFRLQTARKPETRQKRLEQFIRMLERHEKLHP